MGREPKYPVLTSHIYGEWFAIVSGYETPYKLRRSFVRDIYPTLYEEGTILEAAISKHKRKYYKLINKQWHYMGDRDELALIEEKEPQEPESIEQEHNNDEDSNVLKLDEFVGD